MPVKNISDAEYRELFLKEKSININALHQALDIRKYEIEHYWKRATYFWAFIAATFAGFIAIQTSSAIEKTDFSVLICSLGIVFSFGWYCVNRGSKFWQENWEKHVDMLEDNVNGPLYKVVLSRSKPIGFRQNLVHFITGPSDLSVSKINQIISLYITVVWIGLLTYSLPKFSWSKDINCFYTFMIVLTIVTCISFFKLAKSYHGGYWHLATIRTSSIKIKK